MASLPVSHQELHRKVVEDCALQGNRWLRRQVKHVLHWQLQKAKTRPMPTTEFGHLRVISVELRQKMIKNSKNVRNVRKNPSYR